MVESKDKTAPRARIAHKLARYYRAIPTHLAGTKGPSQPSTSHLQLGGAPTRRLRNADKTWYPADDQKKKFKRACRQPKASKGRWGIQPGSVVILLSGKNRGRRVVVLKSLKSGNLLVTGPYAINGVPLSRVNPAYCIATSTIASIAGVNAENINDEFFKRARHYSKNELKNASEHRQKKVKEGESQEQKWREEAKKVQSQIDGALVANIKKEEHLKGYLQTRFTLSNSTRPHELKF